MYSYLFKHTHHADSETKMFYLNKGISYPNNENLIILNMYGLLWNIKEDIIKNVSPIENQNRLGPH